MNKLLLVGLICAACGETNESTEKIPAQDTINVEAIGSIQDTTEFIKTEVEEASPQANPTWVVEQIFIAARNRKFSILSNLCDPLGDKDYTTRNMCRIESLKEEIIEDFVKTYKKGKLTGSMTITGDEAVVPILTGEDGNEKAVVKLKKRDGLWYLSSIN